MRARALPRNAAATILALLVAAGSTAASVAGADPADTAAYEAAKKKVGRDAEAHVRLALWCEQHGLSAEGVKHLALAVLIDPKNAHARGLMGLVEFGGRWRRPDAVGEAVKSDEALAAALAEYNSRRARTPDTPDAQWKLALWCDENGLESEAVAHLTAVARLDPGREAAWKRLGYRKVGGRWVTGAQLAAEKAEAEAQKKADRHWKPLLMKWRDWLGRRDHRREAAEEALGGVTDPRAVPSVWSVFAASRDAAHQIRAVEVFGRIESPGASRALAALAVVGISAEARRAAVETLARRDRREYLDLLIAAVRDPIKFEVRPVGGPGSPGALFIQGKQVNVQRRYAPPAVPEFPVPPGSTLVNDPNTGLPVIVGRLGIQPLGGSFAPGPSGFATLPNLAQVRANAPSAEFQGFLSTLAAGSHGAAGQQLGRELTQARQSVSSRPNVLPILGAVGTPGGLVTGYVPGVEKDIAIPVGQMVLEAEASAAAARSQLQRDAAALEEYNNSVRKHNDPVLMALSTLTGEDLGEGQKAWSDWWTNQKGYALRTPEESTATVVEDVPLGYIPQIQPQVFDGQVGLVAVRHSCFGGDTPVRTLDGFRPIQAIRAGDRVLTQDPTSGELRYQPVVAVYHNPPNQTLRVAAGGETVVATGIHRFWKAGHGWVMARELKPGDLLRTLGGTARVESVTDDAVQPVFNLEVGAGQSFFVGTLGALVHDNSLVEPVDAPFDAPLR